MTETETQTTMTPAEVIALMETSQSEREWRKNCNEVKRRCGGDYPDFWYEEILASGVGEQIMNRWGGTTKIRVHRGPLPEPPQREQISQGFREALTERAGLGWNNAEERQAWFEAIKDLVYGEYKDRILDVFGAPDDNGFGILFEDSSMFMFCDPKDEQVIMEQAKAKLRASKLVGILFEKLGITPDFIAEVIRETRQEEEKDP